jgi:Protein of unknown function (DUF3224)
MTFHAEGTCVISAWNEEALWKFQGTSKLAVASIRQKYTGDLVGISRWEALLCHLGDGTIRFAGLARLDGRLGGRSGEFTMEARGMCKDAEIRLVWTIVPDSGTGELRGLSGTGTCILTRTTQGDFTLDYEFS